MEQAEKVYDIYYDNEIKAVVMEWQGYATSHEFRIGTELMFQTMKKFGTSKVLGNITHFVLIGMDDQIWLLNDFLPKAIELRLRKCGLTIPLYYFNKVAVETIVSGIFSKIFEVRLFKNLTEARNWISE